MINIISILVLIIGIILAIGKYDYEKSLNNKY